MDMYSSRSGVSSQRFMIWLTLGLMSIFGVGLMGLMKFVPPPPANLSANEVLELYRANPIRFKFGAILGLLAGGCITPLTVVISAQMARVERGVPVWAILQGLTGAVGTAFFWLPMICFATASFSLERAPELTLLLHELGWICFIVPVSLFPLQLLGICVVSFSTHEDEQSSAFPRWIGYLNAWVLITSLGAPMAVIFKTGIFAWNGLVPFYIPLTLFSIWLPAMSYSCLRALRFQESPASQATPAAQVM
ncbi:MAG: hypothetical protein KGM18_00650 [Sphingomonadales bacterium]|nr:hypothetical protein [Sphingomonadales bacterium]